MAASSFFDFEVDSIDKKKVALSSLKGKAKAFILVNLASKWGLTSANYKELNSLHEKYSKDLMIIGFPCNDFGAQEPGSNEEVRAFADGKGAKWQIMGKVSCQSSKSHPLFEWLQQSGDLQWNFHKFLIDKDGKLVKNYEPGTSPMSIEPDILKLMK